MCFYKNYDNLYSGDYHVLPTVIYRAIEKSLYATNEKE